MPEEQKPSATLTPAIVVNTDVPFPIPPDPVGQNIVKNAFNDAWKPHSSRKIQVEACSELMDYQFPVDVFSVAGGSKGQHNGLALTYDKDGQQMIFSINEQHRLYALCYVQNTAAGWQAEDITPPERDDLIVDTFDVLHNKKTIYIAVAVRIGEADGVQNQDEKVPIHQIWWTSFEQPNLSGLEGPEKLQGLPTNELVWKKIPNNAGNLSTTTIKCIASQDKNAPIWLMVGTTATRAAISTTYTINVDTRHSKPWQLLSLSEGADVVLQSQPALLGFPEDEKRWPAAVRLYQHESGDTQGCSVDRLDETMTKRISPHLLLTAKLGQLRSFATSTTYWGASDVFVAAEKGIGYYSSQRIEKLHSVILPDISFQQVVASDVRYRSKADPKLCSKLSILAVSDEGGLYFIEGQRFYDGTVKFPAFGVPIRTQVRMISAQYNTLFSTNEVVCVSQRSNEICHLARDPVTSLWNEAVVSVRSPKGKASFVREKAFVTTLTITDEDGIPVPDEYPVEITGEAVQVSVNSCAFSLGSRPTTIRTTGGFGQISIVTRSHGLIGASDYRLKLTAFADGVTNAMINIQPSQRVTRLMSSITSANDLKVLKDASGKPLFHGVDTEKLDSAAQVMSAMMVAANGGQGVVSNESTITWMKGVSDSPDVNRDSSWFESASETVGVLLGDIIEYLKSATKVLVKCALKIQGTIIKFFVKIGLRVLSYELKGVGAVLRGLCGFLQEYLGVDTGSLMQWVSFVFDSTTIAKTQKVILDFTEGTLKISGRVLKENRESISEMFQDARDVVKKAIDDPRPIPEPDQPKQNKYLARFLNNPVIKALLRFNPLSWIMEAITEEVDMEGWQIPKIQEFAELANKHAMDGVEALADCIFNIIEELIKAGGDVLSDSSKFRAIILRVFKSSVWEVFDAAEVVALSIYDLVIDIFGFIFEFLTGEWVIPGFTDLWEDLTGQRFSLLGFATYLLSTLLNFSSISISGKLPFDGVKLIDWDLIQVPRFYKSSGHAAPPGPNDIIVRMTKMPDYDHEKISKQPIPGSDDDWRMRQVSKGLCIALSEMIGSFLSFTEVVAMVSEADFRPPSQNQPIPSNPKVPTLKIRDTPKTGMDGSTYTKAINYVGTLSKLPHLIEFALLALCASFKLGYTLVRTSCDPEPAPTTWLCISLGLDVTALAVTKFPTPSIVAMQSASGMRAIAETCHSGIHAEHWFHHLNELIHIYGAVTSISSIVAKKAGNLEFAIPLAALDCGLSYSASIGGILSTFQSKHEEHGDQHEGKP